MGDRLPRVQPLLTDRTLARPGTLRPTSLRQPSWLASRHDGPLWARRLGPPVRTSFSEADMDAVEHLPMLDPETGVPLPRFARPLGARRRSHAGLRRPSIAASLARPPAMQMVVDPPPARRTAPPPRQTDRPARGGPEAPRQVTPPRRGSSVRERAADQVAAPAWRSTPPHPARPSPPADPRTRAVGVQTPVPPASAERASSESAVGTPPPRRHAGSAASTGSPDVRRAPAGQALPQDVRASAARPADGDADATHSARDEVPHAAAERSRTQWRVARTPLGHARPAAHPSRSLLAAARDRRPADGELPAPVTFARARSGAVSQSPLADATHLATPDTEAQPPAQTKPSRSWHAQRKAIRKTLKAVSIRHRIQRVAASKERRIRERVAGRTAAREARAATRRRTQAAITPDEAPSDAPEPIARPSRSRSAAVRAHDETRRLDEAPAEPASRAAGGSRGSTAAHASAEPASTLRSTKGPGPAEAPRQPSPPAPVPSTSSALVPAAGPRPADAPATPPSPRSPRAAHPTDAAHPADAAHPVDAADPRRQPGSPPDVVATGAAPTVDAPTRKHGRPADPSVQADGRPEPDHADDPAAPAEPSAGAGPADDVVGSAASTMEPPGDIAATPATPATPEVVPTSVLLATSGWTLATPSGPSPSSLTSSSQGVVTVRDVEEMVALGVFDDETATLVSSLRKRHRDTVKAKTGRARREELEEVALLLKTDEGRSLLDDELDARKRDPERPLDAGEQRDRKKALRAIRLAQDELSLSDTDLARIDDLEPLLDGLELTGPVAEGYIPSGLTADGVDRTLRHQARLTASGGTTTSISGSGEPMQLLGVHRRTVDTGPASEHAARHTATATAPTRRVRGHHPMARTRSNKLPPSKWIDRQRERMRRSLTNAVRGRRPQQAVPHEAEQFTLSAPTPRSATVQAGSTVQEATAGRPTVRQRAEADQVARDRGNESGRDRRHREKRQKRERRERTSAGRQAGRARGRKLRWSAPGDLLRARGHALQDAIEARGEPGARVERNPLARKRSRKKRAKGRSADARRTSDAPLPDEERILALLRTLVDASPEARQLITQVHDALAELDHIEGLRRR